MLQKMRHDAGLTRVGLIFICAVILLIAGLTVPVFVKSQRASNERNAATMLKMLTAAEADFRTNDRDGNGVNDFWTADVKGLYTMTSAAVRGANPNNPRDPSLKLIELPLAAADGDGAFVPAGGENVPLSAFARTKARGGYWFLAMLTDQDLKDTPEMSYMMDTKGTPPMGPVHHMSKFAFVAFPDSPSAGERIFVTNESNTIRAQSMPANARIGQEVPPGRKGLDPIWQHWPEDKLFRRLWHPKFCCPEAMPSDEELKRYRARFE